MVYSRLLLLLVSNSFIAFRDFPASVIEALIEQPDRPSDDHNRFAAPQ
jgi:hypothetical protein